MLGTQREVMIDSVLPRRGGMRRIWLASGIAAAALCMNLPAQAQQYGGGTSVVVDYGVLDQLGAPPTIPEGLRNSAPTTVYTQPYGGLQPYGGNTLQPYGYNPQPQPLTPVQPYNPSGGQLQPPPTSMPRSTLTVPYKPSPSIVDGPTTAPSSMATMPATAPAAATPAATVTAMPAVKPAEPETKTAAAVPTPPPAPQPPPTPPPAPAAPETIAEEAPTPPPTPAAPAESVNSSSTASGVAVSTNLPEPPPSGTAATAPATETAPSAATIAPAATTAASTAGAAAATAATGTGEAAESTTGEATKAAEETTTAANETTKAVENAPATSAAPAAETAAPATDESQSASAPAAQPAAEPAQDKTQILFPEGSAELPPEATQQLDAIAQKLDQDQSLRLQLMAYASGTEDTASRARRISLSRALAVRAYLIDKGIRSTRMDVRALGNKVEGDPADRVDIVTLTP